MALKPCLDCGRLSNQARCPEHRRARERGRPQRPTNLTRDATERQRRADAVAAHRRTHGNWCPGYGVPAHPSSDLTADHVISVAMGGDPNGELQVLCRSCNGRKSDG
jgi:5-methylcytosine-specific restriction protein A